MAEGVLGNAGASLLAAMSSIADVHVVTLSLSRMTQATIDLPTAVLGIVTAASVNNKFKVVLTRRVARLLTRRIASPVLVSSMAGLVAAWLA